jgi:hypothetical protein
MPTLPIFDKNVNLSPHVVITGTGASKASYLHSGCIGNPVPLMNEITDMLNLRSPIAEAGFEVENIDFEAFYDDLKTSGKHPKLQKLIEDRVYDYFSHLQLPEKPTIYDYLVVSLRDKDLIATFNWDPFLLQAYRRNAYVKRLPRIAFLHGNVGIGFCETDKMVGLVSNLCLECGQNMEPSRLLYPVKHKDYNSDVFIKNEWEVLRHYLNHAYFLTIFGYSAPMTDVEARSLLLGVWKGNQTHELAQVNIVDTRPRDELEDSWSDFFVNQHYGIQDNIFNSYLMWHPRRSCEALAAATLMLNPWRNNPVPQFETIQELHEWVSPLIQEEDAYSSKGESFSGMPLS